MRNILSRNSIDSFWVLRDPLVPLDRNQPQDCSYSNTTASKFTDSFKRDVWVVLLPSSVREGRSRFSSGITNISASLFSVKPTHTGVDAAPRKHAGIEPVFSGYGLSTEY